MFISFHLLFIHIILNRLRINPGLWKIRQIRLATGSTLGKVQFSCYIMFNLKYIFLFYLVTLVTLNRKLQYIS